MTIDKWLDTIIHEEGEIEKYQEALIEWSGKNRIKAY